jgi:hypothetical protein
VEVHVVNESFKPSCRIHAPRITIRRTDIISIFSILEGHCVMSGSKNPVDLTASELEKAGVAAYRTTMQKTPEEIFAMAAVSASDTERIRASLVRDMELATPEVLAQERAVRGNDDAVAAGFARRRMAEDRKARANALFAEGKWEEALLGYNTVLALFGAFVTVRSALDRRLVAVVHSNRAACFLAMGDAGRALEAARAAVKEDETLEKGWIRLGSACEALPACRADALEAYEKVSSNPVAAKRIAVLREPPIVVTTDGVTGIPEGSLDMRVLAPFPNPVRFYEGLMLPSEPVVAGEARENAYDYRLRLFLSHLATRCESGELNKDRPSRNVFAQSAAEELWFDVMGTFVAVPNVADDGRPRKFVRNAPEVPALLVALWTGKGKPPGFPEACEWMGRWTHVQPIRAMLVRNAALLPDEMKQSAPVGFTLSVLTHMAAPEIDYSVFEGCAAPGCTVECAGFRCGRCFVARYCGKEHMAAHWKVHKSKCVPLERRGPRLTIDCSRSYLDQPDYAIVYGYDYVRVPKKTFPGVVVVKIQRFGDIGVKICDPYGVLIASSARGADWFEPLKRALLARKAFSSGEGAAYFDADMTQEGRLVILLDHDWKCTW